MTDIQQLIAQLNNSATSEKATNALVEMGAAAVEPLLKQLNSSVQGERTLAIRVLGKINDPRVIPALMEHSMRDAVPVVREAAITAVVGFKSDTRVMDFLLQTVRNSAQQDIARMAAIRHVGKLSGADAANALWLEMLNDRSVTMMINAAYNLGNTKNPEFFEPMLKVLNRLTETDQGVAGVLGGLGRLGDKRALEPIAAFLQAKPVTVRAAAAHALAALGDVRALDLLAPLQNDRTVSGQEDHGGPTYTLGSEVRHAMDVIRKANSLADNKTASDDRKSSDEKKPWWKVW